MLWYENIKPTFVYSNLSQLLQSNPSILREECIVFLINCSSGFGSQLTLFTQYSLCLKRRINKNIHCLGHFSTNNLNFKYHDTNYNNSFFYTSNI